MKKKLRLKIIEFLRWALQKLDRDPIEVDQAVYISSDFQTKRGGINIVDAKKLVVGHCLQQAKQYVVVGVVGGDDGYEKAIASIKISRKINYQKQ